MVSIVLSIPEVPDLHLKEIKLFSDSQDATSYCDGWLYSFRSGEMGYNQLCYGYSYSDVIGYTVLPHFYGNILDLEDD